MTLYFISGLGADKRIFEKMRIPDVYKIIYLDWIVPFKNEHIRDYATRLSVNIDTAKPFCIVGLSFGGMLAIELSTIVSPQKTILISSISSPIQRPWYFKLLKILPIYELVSKHFLKIKPTLVYKLMGVENEKEKELFNTMLADTDIRFFKWAINSILKWKQSSTPKNLYHIHGTADLLFPIKYVQTQYLIPQGNHLMVYTKAEEVSSVLSTILIS